MKSQGGMREGEGFEDRLQETRSKKYQHNTSMSIIMLNKKSTTTHQTQHIINTESDAAMSNARKNKKIETHTSKIPH